MSGIELDQLFIETFLPIKATLTRGCKVFHEEFIPPTLYMTSKVKCIEDHVFYFTYRLISRF